MSDDPRIQRLAGDAEEAAGAYDPRCRVEVEHGWIDDRPVVALKLTIPAESMPGVLSQHLPPGGTVTAWGSLRSLEHIDELVRDLLAHRAGLEKLLRKGG